MRYVLEFDILNVRSSSKDADGYLLLNLDDDGGQGSAPVAAQYIHGIYSIPLDSQVANGQVVASGASSALSMYEGGDRHALLLGDPRTIAKLPLMLPGEMCVYNDFGVFERLHADGAWSVSTTSTGGGSDGDSIFQKMSTTAFQSVAPWGSQTHDAMGYRLTTKGGAKFTLGYAGGITPGLSSFARIQAHMVMISGSAIGVGPEGVPQMPVAKAQPLVTVLTALSTAIQAIQASLVLITAGPTTLGGGPAAAACLAAVEASTAQVASALVFMSTQTAVG